MTDQPLAAADPKMIVTFRVEAGCLGPQGQSHVAPFCVFAQPYLATIDADHLVWNLCPRDDVSLPEIQYQIAGKTLSDSQAARYLALIDKDKAAFEDSVEGRIAELITEYQLQT